MSKLKLPVKFDEDFDLIDADSFPLLWGADMIDHNPEIGVEIAMRVNNHERLVEMVRALAYDYHNATGGEHHEAAHELLAELQAGKGGEL